MISETTRLAFFLNNQPDALIFQVYSVIKFYMFRASSLLIIRSFLLYIRQVLMTASKQSQDGTSWLCLEAVIRNLHETYQCQMYSGELTKGREDARKMYSFITE
jgi:hypothetical protein